MASTFCRPRTLLALATLGTVVAASSTAQAQSVSYRIAYLPDAPGYSNPLKAVGFNDLGQALFTGFAPTAPGVVSPAHALLWQNGRYVDVAFGQASQAIALNDLDGV